MVHRTAAVLRDWFALDADYERRPADPRAAYRHDVWLGLALTVLAVVGIEVTRSGGFMQAGTQPTWVLYLLSALGALPLVVRRRYPLVVLTLVYTHFLLVGLTVPVVAMSQVLQVVYFMTLYTAVAWARDRRAMLVVVTASLVAMFGWLFWQLAISTSLQDFLTEEGLFDDPPGLLSPLTAILVQNWLTNIAYFFGAIAIGQAGWNAARRRAQLAEQARTIEHQASELERRAVVTERLRIARELHDVVAHHVSVIGIQAAAARRLIAKGADAPQDPAVPLATIESASRDAVAQMRELVGTLRATDDDEPGRTDRAPEPGLADIATLVAADDDGLDVDWTLVCEPPEAEADVPAALGLSLYRTGVAGERAQALHGAHRSRDGARGPAARGRRPAVRARLRRGGGARRRPRAAGVRGHRAGVDRPARAGGGAPRGGGDRAADHRWVPCAGPPAAAEGVRMTSVLLVDDQRLVRSGFRLILEVEDDVEVVGEASDGAAGVDAARDLRPDVVLMDVQMPVMDGIEATRRIVAEGTSRVLVLTTFDDDTYVFDALSAGASGFLLKNADADHLVEAVRTVASGQALLSPEVTRRVVERMVAAGAAPVASAGSVAVAPDAVPSSSVPSSAPSSAPGVDLLTPREREVLILVGRGMSNAEIAAELFLGEATVKTHVSNVLAKLHLRDRVQAVVFVHRHHLGDD